MSTKSNGSKRSSSPKESSNPASDEDQKDASHQQDHQNADHGGTEVTTEDRGPVAGRVSPHVVTGTDDEPHPQTGAVRAPWPASVTVRAVPTVIVCPREPALRPRRAPGAAPPAATSQLSPPQIGEARSQGIKTRKSVVIMDYPQQPQGYPQPMYYPPHGYPPQGYPHAYTAPGQYPYPQQQPYYQPQQPQQQQGSGACGSCLRACCSLCAGWASCLVLMPCLAEHVQDGNIGENVQEGLGNIAGQAQEGLGNLLNQR